MNTTPPITQLSSAQLETLRKQMLQFVFLQIQQQEIAEDIVQETLFNALKNGKNFKGKAQFKTYLFAILKHKMVDYFRQKDRLIVASDLFEERKQEEIFFDKRQHWKKDDSLHALPHLESEIYSEQFWQTLEICLTHLPSHQSQVFILREYLELTSKEICENLNITASNLHVLLYRARLQLQQCLTSKWQGEKK